MRRTKDKMDSNCLVYPAFAKGEGKTSERALSTRNPLLPFCRLRRIGSRDVHARLAKRQGDFNLACELWKDAIGNSRHGYEAYEQLAIYYERTARNPERAEQTVHQALNELRQAIQIGEIAPGPYREIRARFDRRLRRFERKTFKPLLKALTR
jgi:hypothetical protein